MRLVPQDLELSRRRAPAREAVLLFLHVVEEASLWEISEATGVRPSRVVGIMEGSPREYSRALSLSEVGAAWVRQSPGARVYRITTDGHRAALVAAERLGLV